MSSRRSLLVHAHPDDESLTTGGTIAHYARAGVEVTVLTCSLGEEGEVIGQEWAGLTADRADQLGGYRILELTRALDELGAQRPRFLGGAGRWRDSGMVGTAAAANPCAFVNADPREAVGVLVAVIREIRPQVVVCYDPGGGYGHPDHVQVHRFATAAVEAASAGGYPGTGEPWQPAKVYWTVTDGEVLARELARIDGIPVGWRLPVDGEPPSVPAETVTTEIDVSHVLDAKRAAFRAHATQVTLAPSGSEYALSNNIAQPVLREEHFALVRGHLGPVGDDGREHDLFAGIAE